MGLERKAQVYGSLVHHEHDIMHLDFQLCLGTPAALAFQVTYQQCCLRSMSEWLCEYECCIDRCESVPGRAYHRIGRQVATGKMPIFLRIWTVLTAIVTCAMTWLAMENEVDLRGWNEYTLTVFNLAGLPAVYYIRMVKAHQCVHVV